MRNSRWQVGRDRDRTLPLLIVRSRLAQSFVTLALVLSIGLQWVLVQAVAWTGMVVHYAEGGDIAAALEQTFDGEHPCQYCLLIEREMHGDLDDDSKQESKAKKLELALPEVERFIWSVPAEVLKWRPWAAEPVRVMIEADDPPPRVVVVV
jgi:hypothetical protein